MSKSKKSEPSKTATEFQLNDYHGDCIHKTSGQTTQFLVLPSKFDKNKFVLLLGEFNNFSLIQNFYNLAPVSAYLLHGDYEGTKEAVILELNAHFSKP